MIGPVDIKRIVICTGPRDLALSRFVGARLSHELPAMDIQVYYQSGKSPTRNVNKSVTTLADKPPVAPENPETPEFLEKSEHAVASNSQMEFQPPESSKLQEAPQKKFSKKMRQRYWETRARWKRWGTGFYRWRYFKQCNRQIEKQLHVSTPQASSNLRERCVMSVNDQVDEIRSLNPDLILIAGGGKVDAVVLEIPSLAINIHSGKLPEYRGVRSALFALSNNEPEEIGVTLHVAEAAIDGGDTIKFQPVNPAEAGSMPQLWVTLYETGVNLAVDTIRQLLHSSITTYSQTGTIHHYKMRDINASVIRSAYRNFRNLPRQQTEPTLKACSQPA